MATLPFTFARFFVFFCTFFLSVYVYCFFLLWAASYDGLSLHWQPANVTVDVYYLCYVLGKYTLSLSLFLESVSKTGKLDVWGRRTNVLFILLYFIMPFLSY